MEVTGGVESELMLSACLALAMNADPDRRKILHLVDFSVRQRLPVLARLEEIGAYHVYQSTEAARTAVVEMLRIATWRHHHLLTAETPTIDAYNRAFERHEPVHLLVVNLDDVANDAAILDALERLKDGGADAGVLVLILDEMPEKEPRNDRLARFCASLPRLRLMTTPDGAVTGTLAEDSPGCEELVAIIKEFGLTWQPPDVEAEELVERILERHRALDDGPEDFLSIPIAKTHDGRSEICFALGARSGCNHAFILGMSGMGKTAMINNLILGIADEFSPREVRLFLMDYKDGVEFQVFKDLPHCEKIFLDNTDKAAAIGMVTQFAEQIEARGARFREAGVKSISDWNSKYPGDVMPRLLLIVDEAQELFTDDWKETGKFNELLKRVVKKGRAFGVHIIMATQTLLSSNIDREIMTQIGLRIAFKLNNDGDCDRIFNYGNNAPRYLDKYELICNNESGLQRANRTGRSLPPRDVASTVDRIRQHLPIDLRTRPEIVTSQGEEQVDEAIDAVELQIRALMGFQPLATRDPEEAAAQARQAKLIESFGIDPDFWARKSPTNGT